MALFFRLPSVALALLVCGVGGRALPAAEIEVLYPEEIFPALRPLLETASRHAPELRARAATIDEREGQALVSLSQRNSSLRLHGRIMGGWEQRFGDDLVDLDRDEEGRQTGRPTATLSGTLWWEKPIFAWGNLDRYARLGELGVEAARLDYAESTRVHLNEVRDTFLRWQMAARQLELIEENVGLADRIVEAQRQLEAAGRISEQQLLELEARLLETEESRAFYWREQQYFRDRLAVLVGDEAAVADLAPGEVPDFVLPEPLPPEEWVSLLQAGSGSRPALERERRYAAIDATRAQIVARNQRPTLDVVAGLFTDRLDSAGTRDSALRLVGYVGLQVRWNIFDGRRSEGERIAALARQRAREARLEAAEAEVIDQGARLAANLQYQLAQAQSRERRAELLGRRLELADRSRAEDRISPIDLLELRLDYLRARQRALESKAQYLVNMTQLAALVFQDPVAGL